MENEVALFDKLLPILPYISSVVCSIVSGLASYCKARKDAKQDMAKLEKQHEFDIEKERQKYEMEKEKMELDHKHQLELLQAQFQNQLGANVISTLTKEYARSPAGQAQMRNAGQKKRK